MIKKVIVSGANGFVGSAVCKELSSRGISVTAIIRNEESDIARLKDVNDLEIVYCDLGNLTALTSILKARDYDCFYHFAWTGSAGSLRGDYKTQLNNVEYTCRAVEVAKELGCKRFVFAASIMEYEIEATMKTTNVTSRSTLYSTSKITAEYMARILADDLGIEYVGGIISNIYGPGEMSPRLVNTTIRKLQGGEHCSFSAGEQMYDFIYIDDAAKAFYELGENAKSHRSYYIGSRNPRPLKEFLIKIRNVVSPDEVIGLGEIPFNGISLTYKEFDVDALYNDTGFLPSVSFEQGIKETAEWMKKRGE